MKQFNIFDLTYTIWLDVKGEPAHQDFQTSKISRKTAMTMTSTNCDRLGFCNTDCGLDNKCHPLVQDPDNPGTYFKLCTVIFHDAIKPEWGIEELI